jgi:ABC-type phosphate/phosphonate transport system substrate-binding protein
MSILDAPLLAAGRPIPSRRITSRLASLGMYDLPSTASSLDDLWHDCAARLRAKRLDDVPATLTRHCPLEAVWRDPNLLVGQTCGYPLVKHLAGRVRVVASPVYDVPGCEGAWHSSFVVVPASSRCVDLRSLKGSRAVINSPDSNTGMNLFRAAIAPVAQGARFFADVAVTGGHAASLAAVASEKADVAAIDCVSFWLMSRERPYLTGGVRILAKTPPSPSLPLVTSAKTSDEELALLRDALAESARSFELAAARRVLGLTGFSVLPVEAYTVLSKYERDATALDYPLLV